MPQYYGIQGEGIEKAVRLFSEVQSGRMPGNRFEPPNTKL